MIKKETELLDEIKSKYKLEGKIQKERRICISITKNNLIAILKELKNLGFIHLSSISVTDWLDEGNYEITYHLWSYDDKILFTVKTKISRDKPEIQSVTPIWEENAQIHERELHELFGVKFKGNLDLSPLFLEDWRGPPPFRKDFNWREYVKENYYDIGNKRETVYYD